MTRVVAILCICLGMMVAGEAFVSAAEAQSAGGETVAQNNPGPGGFFRRLFRRDAQPQPPEAPRFLPRFQAPGAVEPRRERRARTVAPQPREVAAVEKAPNAKRAVVVGDFFATALSKGLAETYRENPNVVVIDATNGSSGLVRRDYYDWPASLPGIAAQHRPDVILVMIGGNDRQGIAAEIGDQPFGTDGWRTAYAGRLAALADALKATAKPVLWGGLVPVGAPAMSRDYSAFNGMVREQLEAKGLHFVDMWNGFADEDGKYVAAGPDVRGQEVQLRSDDGLNFTRAGQRKLAYFVEQELNDIFGGTAPLLGNAVLGATDAALAPEIGPMVSLDALALIGGEKLSVNVPKDERGGVAIEISARLAKEDSELPPVARADSFVWPPPPPAVPAIEVALPTFGGPR